MLQKILTCEVCVALMLTQLSDVIIFDETKFKTRIY